MPSSLPDGGIRMSVRTTSGSYSSTASSSESTSAQAATTSIPGEDLRSSWMPSRRMRLSSATTTLSDTRGTIAPP